MAAPARTARRRPWLAGFAAINAVAAWGGVVGLVGGWMDFGDVINSRLPFRSVVLAGLSLAVVVALPLTALARAAWAAHPRTNDIAAIVGLLLVGWIIVQIMVLRAFSPFQPFYLCVGVGFLAASQRISLSRTSRGRLAVPVGAVALAVGIGLVPHLIKRGLTAMSGLSVLLVAAGGAAVVLGARWVLAGRWTLGGWRRVGQVGSGLSIAVAVVATVSVVAPAVAVTHVPATSVGATPTSHGLEFEAVTLTTSDDVALAAWFVRGTNGAGVVVLHGAGSTRSAVLPQAAALVAGGYSVMLVDARGHGDSDGTAMDFGWHGDLDIAAAIDFLAAQPGVDPRHIGLVGFSMGGEEAIGAAAVDPRVRAVVAEGATARSAADKAWLSDQFGWRGWVQEQLERVQDSITSYLSAASPPIALRDAVSAATGAHFLLITAGEVADEGSAAAYLRSAAVDRVWVWPVEGAGHTGGYGTDPAEWQQHVIEFLDLYLLG